MNSIAKTTFLLLAVSASFLMSSCDKVAELFQVQLSHRDTINFDIPVSQIDTINISETVQFNVDSFIRVSTNDNASVSNLKSAKLNTAVLTLKGNSNQDFSIFKRVEVAAFSNNNLSPVTLVVNSPLNDNKSVNLQIIPDRDLLTYFNATSFTYSVYAEVNDGPVAITEKIPCELVIDYTLLIEK